MPLFQMYGFQTMTVTDTDVKPGEIYQFALSQSALSDCFAECNCDIGGSETPVCDRETGQCPCKPRVEGRRCDMYVLL